MRARSNGCGTASCTSSASCRSASASLGPALGRRDQPAAAQRRGDRPRAAELAPPRLELRLHVARGVEVAGQDERLGEVGRDAEHRRLADVSRCSGPAAARGGGPPPRRRRATARGSRATCEQRMSRTRGPRAPRLPAGRSRRGRARTRPGRDARRPARASSDRRPPRSRAPEPSASSSACAARRPRPAPSARRGPRARRAAAARSSRGRGSRAAPRALELGEEQLARLGEVAVDVELEPEDSSGGVVARDAPSLARSSAVGAQEQLALDTFAAAVAERTRGCSAPRRAAPAPGRPRRARGRLGVPQRPLQLAAHHREQQTCRGRCRRSSASSSPASSSAPRPAPARCRHSTR